MSFLRHFAGPALRLLPAVLIILPVVLGACGGSGGGGGVGY